MFVRYGFIGITIAVLVFNISPVITQSTPEIPSPVPVEIREDLYYRQIQEGVFIFTHEFPWPANSMIVEMEDSTLVMVDTPYTPEATDDVFIWIEMQFGEREVIAINTGFHVDNLGGNSYLVDNDIPVYGSRLTEQLLEDNGEETRVYLLEWLVSPRYRQYYEAHETIPYVAPTHIFALEEGVEIQVGEELVQVYYPGPSHTLDNVVVYFPNKKVLFGGCMILAGDSIGNTVDADLEEWPDSVRRLYAFDSDVIVPGHGDRFDVELLEHTIDLLEREN